LPRPLPSWNIYVLRATPAKFVGIVEAPDADAAIEEAIKEFEPIAAEAADCGS
jgi:hypothetical protein